ncbi:hypothetical protein M3650_19950 [Paenibacillus sp. MER TA 81-3]|uniref:hypothetical protein n=1 Tax=Paenibacillus sp. MER TA 81-3 TaxID=2939573 RepID=UPI002041FE27|nr:hypothetical protein [Paenibacillus sp. MER TA 81-3]MCM3340843.1 hypothetical protein [Paenibacillus sp. MER TA 81-3]
MELDKWLLEYNVKSMIKESYNKYIENYKLEAPKDYAEVFGNKDVAKIDMVFHSVSYVINYRYIEEYKYKSVKIRLEYDDSGFAEYEAIYDFNGQIEDDYFRII